MFELWQSFSDDALTECPRVHDGETDVCGASVRKVFSKVGISFKGEGFYKNDHGSSAKPVADTPTAEKTTAEKPKDAPKTDSSSSSSSTTSGTD
jgi:predicted nucleic acid-binding Zn ribbon protein